MKTPTPDQLHIAAQWLDIYEGAEDATACQAVKSWLLEQAEAAELRKACREARVPVSRARAAIKARTLMRHNAEVSQ